MIYVFGGTLNLAQSINQSINQSIGLAVFIMKQKVMYDTSAESSPT